MALNFTKIREYAGLELLAKQMVEGFVTGLHKSPYHGFSVEFAEHRLYNTGESTRHIDWKVLAKTDKMFVKRYEEETNLRCQILIDTSSSMYYPAPGNGKINFSITAAACLAYMLRKQRDAVGLTTFADQIDVQTQVKSTASHLHQLFVTLEQLQNLKPDRKRTAAAEVIHQIADKIHKRSLVIIFSDMLENTGENDDLFAALNHLRHNRHEVLIFHVMDNKTELDFDFEDRPYEFEDTETGEIVKAGAAEVREHFRSRAAERLQKLRLKCGQFKIDMIEADIGQNIDQILLPYLIKRGKMR